MLHTYGDVAWLRYGIYRRWLLDMALIGGLGWGWWFMCGLLRCGCVAGWVTSLPHLLPPAVLSSVCECLSVCV